MDFVVPPGCSRSVTDFWGWGAYRAHLRCTDDVSDGMYERGVPGGALNLNSTGYSDHGRYGGSSPARENSHGITGNRAWDLIASSQKFWPPSHEAGLPSINVEIKFKQNPRLQVADSRLPGKRTYYFHRTQSFTNPTSGYFNPVPIFTVLKFPASQSVNVRASTSESLVS
jgi:hypothetical protein